MLLLVASFLFIISGEAKANTSNEVMKACLKEYNYSPDKFYSFDFSKPAYCHSKWRAAETSKERIKLREFLLEHPWYKGKNWRWETRSEYTCVKRYDLNGIEVCTKPFYQDYR
jgi:hypothetical protein